MENFLTGKDAGDAFERHGTTNLNAAIGHLGRSSRGFPWPELGKRSPPDLADLFDEVQRQINDHGDVETDEHGWTFTLAGPFDAPNGDRVEQVRLTFPDWNACMALRAPERSRSGAARMRWQISSRRGCR